MLLFDIWEKLKILQIILEHINKIAMLTVLAKLGTEYSKNVNYE